MVSEFKHWLKMAYLLLRDPERALKSQQAVDDLYALIYRYIHDAEVAPDFAALQTQETFLRQWRDLPEGEAMLSDTWFKSHVEEIITEQEILLKPEWFAGKEILDAGCGGGRWSYGLARLGAQVTAVDINASAIEATDRALTKVGHPHRMVQTPLEALGDALPKDQQFDLVWSWGVLHHCRSFVRALDRVCERVKPGGVIYLYLYGRESVPFGKDVQLFKERVRYNALPTEASRLAFLLEKAGGDETRVHQLHDNFAPLINRRYTFEQAKELLEARGFSQVLRAKDWPELFIRAVKGDTDTLADWSLEPPARPYWFERYRHGAKRT